MLLTEPVLEGNRLALARLLSQVENDFPEGSLALAELFQHTGRAHLIGVTGAPGTGKSSLVNQLALHCRKQSSQKVAILAVDPSSPFTGGAVLGDRVRMRDLSGDDGIFIRSMASRGSLGGIALKTAALVQVFDAAGYETIMIETVGAGQNEVEIAQLAHTTVVVEAPGLGDEIQAIKAGILEIADVLVINKADRPGVENTERALRSSLELGHPLKRGSPLPAGGARIPHHAPGMFISTPAANSPAWIPPILKTVATEGKGIAEVAESINRHAAYLRENGEWAARDRARLGSEMEALLREALVGRFLESIRPEEYDEILEKVLNRNLSPYEAVHFLLDAYPK